MNPIKSSLYIGYMGITTMAGPKVMTNVLSRNCREKTMLLIIKAQLRGAIKVNILKKKTWYIGDTTQ